jgi:hypothetical protein
MAQQYRVYLDTCCLNRPFDSPSQARVLLEADAILAIVQRCQNDEWSIVSSDALEFELEKIPDPGQAEQVASLLALKSKSSLAKRLKIEQKCSSIWVLSSMTRSILPFPKQPMLM